MDDAFPNPAGSGTPTRQGGQPAARPAPAGVLAGRPWVRHYDPGVPATVPPAERTLGEVLRESAAAYGDRPAMHWFGATRTYRQLDDDADRAARAFAGLGLRPGDRVALLLPNSPHYVIAFYGALRAGLVVVPLNPLYTPPEVRQQLRDCGATTIVTLSMFYATVRAVQAETELRSVVVANVKDYFKPHLRVLFTLLKERKDGHRAVLDGPGAVTWNAFLAGAPDRVPLPVPKPDDVATWQYTGGTTGVPKAAMLTHRNLVTNVDQCAAWTVREAGGTQVTLAALPFFHSYGMTVVMNLSIAGATPMVLLPNVDVPKMLKAIQDYHCTHVPGVPAIYIALLEHPDRAKFKQDSIEVCLSGAAPLPVEVQRRFEELSGSRVVEGYGMTECSPVALSNPLYGTRKPGSIGIPFPGIDAKVVDAETGTTELPTGQPGELILRGPTVMVGYANRPDETALTLRDGWLHTGDIAVVDDDGYFSIVDRKKDMILSNGFNVFPRDVEEVIFTHPAVADAVVIGAPNARGDETVKAYVVRRAGVALTEDDLIAFCRERLARYKAPRVVEFRDELPKTMVGKALRRVLVQEEREKLAAAGDKAPANGGTGA